MIFLQLLSLALLSLVNFDALIEAAWNPLNTLEHLIIKHENQGVHLIEGEEPQNFVVGGFEAEPNSIPWQVALVKQGKKVPFCGGTIICEKFVMTAAHCIGSNRNAAKIQILSGEHDVLDDSDGSSRHDVQNIFVHPNYIVKNRLVILLQTYFYQTTPAI